MHRPGRVRSWLMPGMDACSCAQGGVWQELSATKQPLLCFGSKWRVPSEVSMWTAGALGRCAWELQPGGAL